MFIDEYYIPAKIHYRKEHFVHETLVYGFNDQRQHLLALGFGKDNLLGQFTISYELFIQAFDSGRKHYKDSAPYAKYHAVTLLKLAEVEGEYPFDKDLFLHEFKDYLQSKTDKDYFSTLFPPGETGESYGKLPVVYGLDTYDLVISQTPTITQK